MFLKAAINGGCTHEDHPGSPTTPEAIAEQTKLAIEAGADVVHFHVRDDEGGQSIDPDRLDSVLNAIRAIAPHACVGTTTGLWTVQGGHVERLAAVRSWRNLPDFASVAFCEEGAEETAQLVVSRGMTLESAVWSIDDVPALLRSSVLDQNVRVLIEPLAEDPDDAVEACREMAAALRAGGVRAPLLYHGDEATVWPVLRAAAEDGAQIRIGFEDGIELPNGCTATDNAELIRAAISEHQTYRTEEPDELGAPGNTSVR